MDIWRFIHMMAMAWLGLGLGATYPLIVKAYASKDVKYQMYCLVEAANNETRYLLPGAMATGITGFFWAVADNHNFAKEGWLFALSAVYVVVWFVCLPLMGFGLRRARLASLIAAKKGVETPELRDILNDRVPIVFGSILLLSVPVIGWLAVFKPF